MLYTISILLRRISNFILNIFIARLITLENFGEYSQYTILVTYLLLVTEFGYSEYILVKSKKENNLDFLLTNFTLVSFLTFILIGVILFFFNNSLLLILVLIKVYLDAYLSKLILTYYQFKQNFTVYSILNIAYSFVILTFIFFLEYLNFTIVNIIMSVDVFLIISILLLIVKSNINIKSINIKKLLPFLKKDFTYYAMSSITIPIYMQLPIFIMTFFVEKEEIAIFYLAFTISSVMLLISISINQQYLPKLLHEKNKSFYTQIKFPILLLILFNLFTFILFYFFGEAILSTILNKPEYIESNKYILLLMISNIFQSLSGLMALYLVSNDLMQNKFYIQLEFILLSLILGLILIINYELLGVALTYIILYFYALIRYVKYINKVQYAK
jgi:O-antigen/teichoic acid export membrane protein